MQQSLAESGLEAIVLGCCERLLAANLPLVRGYFAFSVLHPLHSAIGITWLRGTGTTARGYAHVPGGITEAYRNSPFAYMERRGLDVMRIGLTREAGAYGFSILGDLKEQGLTDYLAFRIMFDERRETGMIGSWATDRAAGFSEAHIETFIRIQRRLAVASKMAVKSELMKNLAETYLGKDAGRRVLDGQIRRGDGQSIEAAIWYADLRSSTTMADTLPRQDYIDTLNAFFDATGGAVQDRGGEVLSFIGDSLLAIFPTSSLGTTADTACAKALEAACEARRRLDALNRERRSRDRASLGCGIGLHFGEVMYGNVGIKERLTFSVFGSAVNEVVRLEQLTKQCGEPILASHAFSVASVAQWRRVGEYTLRGVGQPMQVLAPALLG
ncbi:MAG: adenylate/guanylate cyclase domain-containing protein [Hyphomicrobiaceae bacterium]